MAECTALEQKFKAQCLDGAQIQQPEGQDRDSGTESDEENAELLAIEEALQSSRDKKDCAPEVLVLRDCISTTSSLGCDSLSASATPSPVWHPISVDAMTSQHKMTSSPRYQQPAVQLPAGPIGSVCQVLHQPNIPFHTDNIPFHTDNIPFHTDNIPFQSPKLPFQPLSHNTSCGYNTRLGHTSPAECSDYQGFNLDYEPVEFAEYSIRTQSSDDELTFINRNNRHLLREKRKWSQVNRCNSCDDSSQSSDEEIRDILMAPRPLKFGSAPPKGVQKLSHVLPPALFLAGVSSTNMHLCCVSPRKRHRQMRFTDASDVTVIQRPCLDFEKMQLHWLRHHNAYRRSAHR